MVKRMQVFVSSTYTDLIAERQSAVEAILQSGHIPAGMELFAAGDKSQWDTIREWIEESDIFMLILGARYGSIEAESQLSYTQLEYDYAASLGKPLFAAVMSDEYRQRRVKEVGESVLERNHPDLYNAFRATVLSRISRYYDSPKDVKLIVHESLPRLIKGRQLSGWVRGDQVPDTSAIVQEAQQLRSRNDELVARLEKAEKARAVSVYNGHDFGTVCDLLEKELVPVPKVLLPEGTTKSVKVPALLPLDWFFDDLSVGVTNHLGMSELQNWLFFTLSPILAIYGLTEKTKVTGQFQRFQISKLGNRFLAELRATGRAAKLAEKLKVSLSAVPVTKDRDPKSTPAKDQEPAAKTNGKKPSRQRRASKPKHKE